LVDSKNVQLSWDFEIHAEGLGNPSDLLEIVLHATESNEWESFSESEIESLFTSRIPNLSEPFIESVNQVEE